MAYEWGCIQDPAALQADCKRRYSSRFDRRAIWQPM